MLAHLKGDATRSGCQPPTSRSRILVICPIESHAHPAVGQYGLFAAKKIPPRTFLLDYLGEVHCEERASDYDLSLYRSNEGTNIGIDARFMGNEARFINDFRGISDRPNAFFVDRRTDSGELRMSVWSGKEGIKKGSEVVVTYGKSWWSSRIMAPREEL